MTTSLEYKTPFFGMNSSAATTTPSYNDQGDMAAEVGSSGPLIHLDSPAYSLFSDGEYCHNYTESASSIDGSSRPGSDRFHLGGEFSSFESDTFISCTSASGSSSECEDNSNSEPLQKLKSLHKGGGHFKRKLVFNEKQPIVISDSSDEDNDRSHSQFNSPTYPTCPSVLPQCCLSSNKPQSLNGLSPTSPYTISIPLNLITLSSQTNSSITAVGRLMKRPPAKLALSHFATSRKKMRQSSSGEEFVSGGVTPTSDTSRTPISLKLKKSPISNQWQSILSPAPPTDIAVTSNGKFDTPPCSPQLKKTTPSSPIAEVRPYEQTEETGKEPSSQTTSPYAQSIVINDEYSDKEQSKNTCNEEEPSMQLPQPVDSTESPATNSDGIITLEKPTSPESIDPLSCELFQLSNTNERAEDVDNDSTSSTYSLSTYTSTSDSFIRTSGKSQQKNHKPFPLNTTTTNTNQKPLDSKQSFSFESVFTTNPPPQLVVFNGELRPVETLSVKGKWTAPVDHPIHSWQLGKPRSSMTKRRYRKRIKTKMNSKKQKS